MWPKFPSEIAQSMDESPELPRFPPLFYCQIGIGYTNMTTKAALCGSCFANLPLEGKPHWIRIRKHSTIVDGVLIGIDCETCERRLTVSRAEDLCELCCGKYEEYLRDPGSVSHRRIEEIVIINVEIVMEADG